MNTHILFLDDEPLALQGLRRMLRSLRAPWEMTFVESGPQALELMVRSPFDIVVTDMLMPGMNGAQFLNEVRKRHPETVRLILSGHAERDLILQCVGPAHQYLAKPCPPEMLKGTLDRVAALTATLQNHDSLKRLICRLDRFPSVPSLYIDLVETLLRTDVALDEVTNLLAKDIGVTAGVLKLVNSAFFGAPRETSNAVEAISCLGLDTFKTLVFHVNAFSQFEAGTFREDHLGALWEHSVDVAVAAKQIAESESADKKTVDAVYTSGLLHDLGKFLMRVHFAEPYERAIALAKEHKMELWLAERQVFGVSHSEVGAYLVGLWALPISIVEAIAWHHSPHQSASQTFSPLTAVHVANALCSEQREGCSTFSHSKTDLDYLSRLGLLDRLPVWRSALQRAPSKHRTSNSEPAG